MSTPSNREIDAVHAAIPGLVSQEEQDRLRLILRALGVNASTLAGIINVENEEAAKELLVGDDYFDGGELTALAELFHFRPGIVQGKFNFDPAESATNNGDDWIGPHPFLTNGEKVPGDALVRCVKGRASQYGLGETVLGAIERGQIPVPLGVLRRVVADIEKNGKSDAVKGFKFLRRIVDSVPAGIKTVEDIKHVSKVAEQSATNTQKGSDTVEDQRDKLTIAADEKTVTVDGETYSLEAGPDMAKVAVRVRHVIRRDPSKPLFGHVLSMTEGYEFSDKTKILSSVEKERATLPHAVVANVADLYDIPRAAMYTGVGLGFPDPAVSIAGVKPQGNPDELAVFLKERIARKGRDIGLAEGADPWDLFDLMSKSDGADVDWVQAWLTLTGEGESFNQSVVSAIEAVASMRKPLQALFLQMIADGLETEQK